MKIEKHLGFHIVNCNEPLTKNSATVLHNFEIVRI